MRNFQKKNLFLISFFYISFFVVISDRSAVASSLFNDDGFFAVSPYHSHYANRIPRGGGPSAFARNVVTNATPIASSDAAGNGYLIGPLDMLRVTVRDEPNLSGTIIVRPDGRITVPLVEDVVAANKPPEQLARELELSLQAFVRNPVVLVEVIQAVGPIERQIRIVGSADQLGAIPYRDGMTLLDVIIEAGGMSQFAAANNAAILRRTAEGFEEIPVRLGDLIDRGDVTGNVVMEPGDIVMVPEGFFTGEWQASGSVALFTSFTDNEDLDPDGEKDPALIFGATPSISIRGQTARVSAALDASVTGSYQTLSSEGADGQVTLNGVSKTELSRDFLFVDAELSVSQEVLDQQDGGSEAEGNDENQTTIQTYTLSPYILNRLGSFANVETRYLLGATLTGDDKSDSSDDDDDELSDSILNAIAVGVASGMEFNRVPWLFRAGAARLKRFDANDVDAAQVVMAPEYVFNLRFGLIGQFGYEFLDDDDEDLSGFTALGGFRWDPDPTFSLRAEVGRRLENDAAEVSLRYDIGPRTTLIGTYDERVEVGQESQIRRARAQTIDPLTGEFVDRRTGLAFVPRPSAVSISDNISRTRSGQITLTHAFGRNAFSLVGFANNQNELSDGGDSSTTSGDDERTVFGGDLGWSRQLNRKTDFSINGFLSFGDEDESEDNGSDDFRRYGFNIQVNRSFYEGITGFVRYGFQDNDASDSEDDYTENAVTFGVNIPFGL